jgi:hypothetical protein
MARPLRIIIPWFMDLVVVSDPESISKIEGLGDVDRLHAYQTSMLPWWVRFYFRATKFHDDERDLWFFPFESASNASFHSRRAYLEAKVAEGYQPKDVQRIADILTAKVDDDSLAFEMVQVVNGRFFGKEIPRAVTQAAKYTLQKFSEAIFPWKYRRAREARKEVLGFCEKNLPAGVHILDVGHNIGEVVQSTAVALRQLAENLDQPVEETFTKYAPTMQVPRIAIKRSKLNGLLWLPMKPGRTVVIFKIAKAAAQRHDVLFTFGTGRAERSCVFRNFFLQFMRDLQTELKARRKANG